MNNLVNTLKTDKCKKVLELLSFFSLLIYFFVALSGYASWFPGSTKYFVYSSTSGFLLRAITAAFVVVVMALSMVSWSDKIKFKWLYPFLFIILISFVMIFVSQTTYSQMYRTNLYSFMVIIDTSVSLTTNLKMFASFIVDILFGFAFMFVIPNSMNNRKFYNIFFVGFILIMLYSCFYSFIKEKDYYIKFLKGDWHYNAVTIGSIFGNKQQWGIFLAPAFAISYISIFIFWKTKINNVIKILITTALIFSSILFAFCSLAAACKTAILAIIVFCACCALIGLIFLFIKKKYIYSSIVLSLFVFVTVLFTLFMTIDKFHSSGIWLKIYNFVKSLFSSGTTTGGTRLELLRATLQNFPAVNLFFGLPKGTFDAFTRTVIPELVVNVHTGIIIYFGRTGILGLVIYIILFAMIFIKDIKIFKTSPIFSCLLLSILLSSCVLDVCELEIVIMSASGAVFMYNLACASLPFAEQRSKLEAQKL